jgi:DNA-binding MarR family transcriptional regulator
VFASEREPFAQDDTESLISANNAEIEHSRLIAPSTIMTVMRGRLPLPTLLSHTLVAFTIEFDNEFEHQVPHRTTNHGSRGDDASAPWLVSMVMWLMLMRFVPSTGIPVGELQRATRLPAKEFRIWLTRMGKWWGYVVVERDVVRPPPGGQKAIEAWLPLTKIVEQRWEKRFGKDVIKRLREMLSSLVEKLDDDLPDYLPILGYQLLSSRPDIDRHARAPGVCPLTDYALPTLLAKVLLSFAIEFERESKVALAISANVLRLVGPKGVRVRDLLLLSGVSKEAIAACVSRLEERDFALVQPEAQGSRVKTLRLTSKGRIAQHACHNLFETIEQRWQKSRGQEIVRDLRELLEQLVGEPTAQMSPLFRGLEPYPDGWRGAMPKRERLPDYPMVLHRGGFPDGS